jgi:hypothetical protein
MESRSPILFPGVPDDPAGHDLAEIDAAIALVSAGLARRVRLVSLGEPAAVAATGLARAQEAGIGFRLDRTGAAVAVTIGPRE